MADTLLNKAGLNRKRRVFFSPETTYGTMVKPAATDAAKIRSGMINAHKPSRVDVEENRSTRSIVHRYTANTPPTPWEYEFDLRPSGTRGTPPDIHPLIKAAMGTYVNTPATSDVYTLSDAVNGLGSFSIHDFVEAGTYADKHGQQLETLTGATVEEMTITGNGTEAPKIKFSGTGSKYVLTGRDAVDGAPAGAAITVNEVSKYRAGSIVAFCEAADGTTLVDDNTGAGFAVSSITGSVLTLENAPTGAPSVLVTTDIVAPWAPTESVAGSPIDPCLGSMTFGGVAIQPIEYQITIKNNLKIYDNQSFERYASGYHEGYREVTGRFTYRLKTGSLFSALAQRDDFSAVTLTIVLGSVAGSIATIALKGEVDFDNFDRSVDETVIATIPMRGVASGDNAADELAIALT